MPILINFFFWIDREYLSFAVLFTLRTCIFRYAPKTIKTLKGPILDISRPKVPIVELDLAPHIFLLGKLSFHNFLVFDNVKKKTKTNVSLKMHDHRAVVYIKAFRILF